MSSLSLRRISKSFGTHRAVREFNMDIEEGEFISFLGGSGCGKTTTLRMIAGFEGVDTGSISIDGADVTSLSPNRRKIGMVFQNYALFPNMTVRQNIAFGLSIERWKRHDIKARVGEMLDLIHMEKFASRYPHQLSGGQQQRVALARALANKPKVLLLDEPLSALDAKIRVHLGEEIRAIQQKLRITTVYVTHDQEEAMSLSDRIVVMNEGLIEQVGTPSEIYARPRTAFVASFIGTLNVLKVNMGATPGTLSIGGHEIEAHELPKAEPGSDVTIAVRPEMLEVLAFDETPTHNNVVEARIESTRFLGSVVRLSADLNGQPLVIDTFNKSHEILPVRGGMVKVRIPPQAIMSLETRT